jgi:septal ring factor EnvC (AmiA/AmiB activator)
MAEPEMLAIKDANLRMQREMFRLADERNALADSVIVRQEEIERLERLVERITHERDRARADLDMAEQLIRTLLCQKRVMSGALEHIASELRAVMPYVPTHGALADQISAQIVHAQTTLQSVTEEDAEDTPEPTDIMGYCRECGDEIRRDEGNEITNGGERVHVACASTGATDA